MSILAIILISIINVLIIAFSMTYFILYGFDFNSYRKVIKKSQDDVDAPESVPILKEQMNLSLKQHYKHFFILEASLIFYFIFWCVIFLN